MCDIGVIGLSTMGSNLALNIASRGIPTAVYNRTSSRVDDCLMTSEKEKINFIFGFKELTEFVKSIRCPRKIILMVEAGSAVDKVLAALTPLLAEGDLVVDGGNEWFELTERRQRDLMSQNKLHFLGMGVSGGEEGARHGPAMMVGGTHTAYSMVSSVLSQIAGRAPDGRPCVSHVGPGGSGNYVKMVHNGIEYGDMQLIAEAYLILKRVGRLTNDELAGTFKLWNSSELESFLIEITSKIFCQLDDIETDGRYLVDQILDVAGSKGTGKWTTQQAATLNVPCPTITAAVDARNISTSRPLRLVGSQIYSSIDTSDMHINVAQLIEDVKNALYCSKICSYSQGFSILQAASDSNAWDLDLGNIAKCWQAGCIIRAKFLTWITEAFMRNSKIENLLFDESFSKEIRDRQLSWRRAIATGQTLGLPLPAMSASLGYFDSLRCDRLPMNLVQAQRDYFGAHTFERVDRPGRFTYKRGAK